MMHAPTSLGVTAAAGAGNHFIIQLVTTLCILSQTANITNAKPVAASDEVSTKNQEVANYNASSSSVTGSGSSLSLSSTLESSATRMPPAQEVGQLSKGARPAPPAFGVAASVRRKDAKKLEKAEKEVIDVIVTQGRGSESRSSGCRHNGLEYQDGQAVKAAETHPCDRCQCQTGKLTCYWLQCGGAPSFDCVPLFVPGACCPVYSCQSADDDFSSSVST